MAVRGGVTALTGAAVTLALAGGCAALLGVDDFRDAAPDGGAAGAGAGMGTEDCSDGVDNNGDSYADCEDAQCQSTHECLPSPAGDWIGVGWLYSGTSPPPCHEAVDLELFDEAQLDPGDASCECTCSALADATCTAAFRCAAQCHTQVQFATTAESPCLQWNAPEGNSECWASALSVKFGGCSPGAADDPPPVSWPVAAMACVRPLDQGGHCGDEDEICIARPPAGAMGPCLVGAGDVDCPPSYPDRTLYRDGTYDDQRGCDLTACTCDAPAGTSCECTSTPCGVELFTTTDCSAQSVGVAPFNGGCAGLDSAGLHGIQIVGATVSEHGSCDPQGEASSIGEVVLGAQLTVCCATGG